MRTPRGIRTASALIALLVPPAAATAQPAAPARPAPDPIAVSGAFIALSVASIDASRQWYEEKLGLRVSLDPPRVGNADAIVLEGGGLTVELVQHDDAKPLAQAAPGTPGGSLFVHGIFKAGILVSDFDRALATIRERGVAIAIGPFPARDGQRANFIIQDNAGNYLQFIAAR
jgi:catechol 2,3-dioxygenase-like lactoylglutathione lyase family enzyme